MGRWCENTTLVKKQEVARRDRHRIYPVAHTNRSAREKAYTEVRRRNESGDRRDAGQGAGSPKHGGFCMQHERGYMKSVYGRSAT